MARALIVGCGCRGRELGKRLLDAGWQVRGTTRSAEGVAAIETAGLEAAVADPDHPASVLELVNDVAVLAWLLGSADGEPEAIEAIHGPRLERLLEKLVDTPVRGFVYEAAGAVEAEHLETGARACREAAARWQIPLEIVEADPREPDGWVEATAAACGRLVGV